ncbi:hypothetical protein [Streptomyces sp. NBC_00872]|uniref:hypothetical protein n=1 Tax=Streptomyces sp. NBC_00872 TaxID=2903686 RepID=UPI003863F17B|nr:hypothetical protein OG214_09935 [Streptomyces sp. NBC_00872]
MGEQGPEMNQGPGGGARAGEGAAAPKGPRLELSVPQVAGSAVAAVAAAVLASRLGVYGTIIGAGVVSVVATCGGPVFQHMLRRTGEQLREVTVQGRPGGRRLSAPGDSPGGPRGEAPLGDGEFGAPTTHGTRVRGWKRPVLAAAGVFVVTMGGITGYELISGHGLSGGAATTVGSAVRGGGGGGGGDDTPATPSGTPSGSTGSPDPGQEQEQGPTSDTPAPGGGTGTDPSGSPGGGAGAGPDQDGSADPSRPPSPAPSHSGSGSGPSSPAPAPTPSDGGGASSRDSHSGTPGR